VGCKSRREDTSALTTCLLDFALSHTLLEAEKAYAEQKKAVSSPRGLSHLCGPQVLLLPHRRIKDRNGKGKKRVPVNVP
jgi:hypothetical protein